MERAAEKGGKKKVEKIDKMFEFLRVFLGIVIAFLICIIIIVLMSNEDPAGAVYNFMIGPFMTPRRFGQVLAKSSSYLLAGLGMCFIYAAEVLGEVNAFYVVVPHWDTMLHTLNGFLAAAVGFAMVVLLNDDERLTFDLSPVFLALVAFCFSMTIGVLWEFFEFGMDLFFHTDMQRDTVVHVIHSAALDMTHSNKVVTIPDIQDVVVNGESLGMGGYLDIGLIDTMKDLFVNFIGAVVFSAAGFLYAKSKGRSRSAALGFVPSKKTRAQDYLRQAREKNGVSPERKED